MTRAAIVPALALLAAAGCVRDNSLSPSLAVRPIEKLGFAEPEVVPAVAAADPALDRTVAALRDRLRTIVAGFDRASAATARAAARPGARTVGSERWLDAQSTLAETDDWRSQANGLAGELDLMASERAAALLPPYPAVADAAAAARAETVRQQTEADRLTALLPAG